MIGMTLLTGRTWYMLGVIVWLNIYMVNGAGSSISGLATWRICTEGLPSSGWLERDCFQRVAAGNSKGQRNRHTWSQLGQAAVIHKWVWPVWCFKDIKDINHQRKKNKNICAHMKSLEGVVLYLLSETPQQLSLTIQDLSIKSVKLLLFIFSSLEKNFMFQFIVGLCYFFLAVIMKCH